MQSFGGHLLHVLAHCSVHGHFSLLGQLADVSCCPECSIQASPVDVLVKSWRGLCPQIQDGQRTSRVPGPLHGRQGSIAAASLGLSTGCGAAEDPQGDVPWAVRDLPCMMPDGDTCWRAECIRQAVAILPFIEL